MNESIKYTGSLVNPLLDKDFMRHVMGAAFRKLIDFPGVRERINKGNCFGFGTIKYKNNVEWELMANFGEGLYLWPDHLALTSFSGIYSTDFECASCEWVDNRWERIEVKEKKYFGHV